MNPWGWVGLGAGIWIIVALILPLFIALFDGRPKNSDEARSTLAVCFAWPALGPLALGVGIIAVPFLLLGKYCDMLAVEKEPAEEGKSLEGKVVE